MQPLPTQLLSGTNLKASIIFLSPYLVQFLLELTEGARIAQASGSRFLATQVGGQMPGRQSGQATWKRPRNVAHLPGGAHSTPRKPSPASTVCVCVCVCVCVHVTFTWCPISISFNALIKQRRNSEMNSGFKGVSLLTFIFTQVSPINGD